MATTFTEYQSLVCESIIKDDDIEPLDAQKLKLVWFVLGLAGEAGEAANLVKKGVLHKHGLDKAEVVDEMGDCLWYVAAVADLCGTSLEELVEANACKIRKRYPDGFSFKGSRDRADVQEQARIPTPAEQIEAAKAHADEMLKPIMEGDMRYLNAPKEVKAIWRVAKLVSKAHAALEEIKKDVVYKGSLGDYEEDLTEALESCMGDVRTAAEMIEMSLSSLFWRIESMNEITDWDNWHCC